MPTSRKAVPTKEDQELDKMFIVVGEALTAWQKVEESLFDVFRTCFGKTAALGPIAVTYTVAETFRLKLNMTDAVMQYTHGKKRTILAQWRELKDEAQSLSGTRNALAHRGVQWLAIGKAGVKAHPALVGGVYDMRHIADGNSRRISRLDYARIKTARDEFAKLSSDLRTFLPRIRQP